MELSAWAQVGVHGDDASERGHVGAVDASRDSEAGGHPLPRIQRATLDDTQAKTRVTKSMTNRFNTRGQPRFAANGTRRRRRVGDTKTAAEGEERERCAPETGAELVAVKRDAQRSNQRDASKHRPSAGLPLRADEQTAQPGSCNPRKH